MMSSAGSGIINQVREKAINGLQSTVFGQWSSVNGLRSMVFGQRSLVNGHRSTVVAEADPGALKRCSVCGFLGGVCWVRSRINREIERDQGDRVREKRERER